MENERATLSIGERVAILETKFEQWESELKLISVKLDELLELKHKGAGAIWFVGLLVGSGVLGLVATIFSLLNRSHV